MRENKILTIGLELIKWTILILAIVLLYNQLFSRGKVSSADFTTVSEQVLASSELSETLEGNNQMIKRLYGLDPADFANVTLLYPSTNMGANELLLIQLKDVSQQDAVKDAIDGRIKSQMDVFDGYAPTQYSIYEKSVTELQGNYVLFISAEDTAPFRQAFLDAIQ